MAPVGWLERYRNGDRARVWLELRQLGAGVREEGLAAEAQAVCDEMAVRARQNTEVVIDRLAEQGYRFHSNDDEKTPVDPLLHPTEDASPLVHWLEEHMGAVPMTVSSWLRLVGDVWLVGTHPAWEDSAGADPLVIELAGLRWPGALIRDHYAEELAAWQETSANGEAADEGFILPVAPDRLHKNNVSGGAPYGFRLPDGCADALFVSDVAMPFVDYLNWVFEQGGFPGEANGQWRLKQSLSQGLLPL